MPDHPHHHTHILVAEFGPNLYYQCRCGSRRHGRRNSTKHFSLDAAWLDGADRAPRGKP